MGLQDQAIGVEKPILQTTSLDNNVFSRESRLHGLKKILQGPQNSYFCTYPE